MNVPHLSLHAFAFTSLLVSGVIALFLGLRPLLRRFIGSQWLCVLWLAILARMLMPWPMEWRWSVVHSWETQANAPEAAGMEPVRVKVSFPPQEGELDDRKAADLPTHEAAVASAPSETHWDFADGHFWSAVWLAGAACSLAMLGWRGVQTQRLGSKTREATDERLLRIFESIPKGLRRGTSLRMADALATPTLAGLFRPQIWMPADWPAQFSDAELRHVLLHELGHARRGDLIVQWLFAVAQCVHWFNPLVWVAGRSARFDREMACDAWALERGGDLDAYGSALMKAVLLLRGPVSVMHGTAAMASSRRGLCARISGIGTFRAVPAWRGALGVLLMLGALAAATTSRTTAADEKEKNGAPQDSNPGKAEEVAGGPGSVQIEVQTKFVEVTEEAWKKLREANPEYKRFEFPELDREKIAYADLKDKMKQGENASWEIPEGGISQLAVLSEAELRKMVTSLNNAKGVDLLAAPSVVTKDGQRAVVEAVMEFKYPTEYEDRKGPFPMTDAQGRKVMAMIPFTPTAFTTRNVGVTMEVHPKLEDGEIALDMKPTLTGFMGFETDDHGVKTLGWTYHDALKAKNFPVFSTSTGKINAPIHRGQTVLMGGVRIDCQKDRSLKGLGNSIDGTSPPLRDATPDAAPETRRSIVLMFVSAKDTVVPPPAPPAQPTGTQIRIDSNIIQISEEAWKKLCPPSAHPVSNELKSGLSPIPTFDFKYLSPEFPQLETEKQSYAELVREWTDKSNTPKQPAPPNMKVIGVLTGMQKQRLMKIVNDTQGCKVLASPVVITKSGLNCEISSGRSLRYVWSYKKSPTGVLTPDFITQDIGFTLQFQPVAGKDLETIDLQIAGEFTTLLGFLGPNNATFSPPDQNPTDGKKIVSPAISYEKMNTDITIWDGQTVLLGSVQLGVGTDGKGNPVTERHIQLVALTAHIIDANNSSQASPSATAANAASADHKAETHQLTWKNYDGTGDPARAEFMLDDQSLGTGAKGIAALRERIATMPKDSRVLVEPYYGDPGGDKKLVYPFDMEVLRKAASAYGVSFEVPGAG